jgi:Signal transduction histidine kinase
MVNLEDSGTLDDHTAIDYFELIRIRSMESISLTECPKDHWQSVETGDATLQTKTNRTIRANPTRLAQLFKRLMRNAVEHTSQDVTVTVGELEGGFYVEDDGSGIPDFYDNRDDVSEAWHSLPIVKNAAEDHGWEISIIEGSEGGARFEITNVEFDTIYKDGTVVSERESDASESTPEATEDLDDEDKLSIDLGDGEIGLETDLEYSELRNKAAVESGSKSAPETADEWRKWYPCPDVNQWNYIKSLNSI